MSEIILLAKIAVEKLAETAAQHRLRQQSRRFCAKECSSKSKKHIFEKADFRPGKSPTDLIHVLAVLIEKIKGANSLPYLISEDYEKTFETYWPLEIRRKQRDAPSLSIPHL